MASADVPAIDALDEDFAARFPRSRAWAQAAGQLLAGGIAHDGRATVPFPLSIEEASGPYKWDVDGHEIIDFWMGHGALMLGHNPAPIVEALARQVGRGTHFGASHPAEVRWARWIVDLVPSAERVRFVASGTEATLMALRIARAATGRSRIVRFEGHFHGWHDWAVLGNRAPFDQPSSGGVPPSVSTEIVVLPANEPTAAEQALSKGDVAGVILEPGGGTQGRTSITPAFLQTLRELTTRTGSVLIFDEVVTGFRQSPGGVQGLTGVTPDVTAMAKIVAGGLPGGAVGGRADLMDLLSFRPQSGRKRVAHPGTFNANPLTAAAGAAMLEAIADGSALDAAAAGAAELKLRLNELMVGLGVPGFAYGDRSIVHILLGPHGEQLRCAGGDVAQLSSPDLLTVDPRLAAEFRTLCLYYGLDLMGPTLMVSSAHTGEVIEEALARFGAVFRMLVDRGTLSRHAA
jgi:glutamate-1-semialdehyde 2,1-aminomutase